MGGAFFIGLTIWAILQGFLGDIVFLRVSFIFLQI
jgi:hypothetical protein